jgi:hypothetical protein
LPALPWQQERFSEDQQRILLRRMISQYLGILFYFL